jgi:hypothetical protein
MVLLSHGRVLLYKTPPQPSGATINDCKPSALWATGKFEGCLWFAKQTTVEAGNTPAPSPANEANAAR